MPPYDFKKEWEKTKKQLIKLGQEASTLAKKGETEIVKLSKQSKLHIDATTAALKLERLFYLIGKEYAGLKNPQKPTALLIKLVDEVKIVKKEQQALKRKLAKRKKSTAKKA